MSKRDWKLYGEDILESLDLIKQYTANMGFDDFKKDRKTIDAVVRNFEIIGEASKYIPENIKKKYQDVDWIGVVGLRNRIVHEYFDIDLSIVWHIVQHELPILEGQMKKILGEGAHSINCSISNSISLPKEYANPATIKNNLINRFKKF